MDLAVFLESCQEKSIFKVTSYPEKTSRGHPHSFFVQIKQLRVKQNRRVYKVHELSTLWQRKFFELKFRCA